jgi:ribonucleoside-diphosphate reductase beta chain
VTQNLVPFVDAAPTEEHQVFLATQLVDGARHAVFYELFDREVWGEEGTEMTARLGWFDDVNPAFRTLAVEMLPAAADRIRRDPADLGAFIEGVVLYHLIIVGRVSLPGQHLLLDWTREAALMPGFTQGLTAIARDGSRHVAFGQRFLEEATERDGRWTDVIDKKLEELTPIALEAIQFATA